MSKIKKHSKTGEVIGEANSSSINANQQRTVNELEKMLMLCSRLIREKIDDGEKGKIINKGKPNEVKVKYENALRTCDRLSSYLGIRGIFSFGICKTCEHFDATCSATEVFGKCKLGQGSKLHDVSPDLLHIYDTCSRHSKRGGGFGL